MFQQLAIEHFFDEDTSTVNMRAGQMPPPEDNGVRYLKIPIDML